MKLPVEILDHDEIRSLIAACSNRAPTGIRNRALIATIYRTGLRLGEALALMPKDISAREQTIRVLNGKGRKARTVGIDVDGLAYIERWLEVRKRHGLNGRHPVFCTLSGQPVKQAYVRALLPRLAEKAGIDKRVHAHGLRHTHAAELAREGLPVNLIQQQLGHASLAVTSRYLDHIAPQQLIEAMKARSWR